MKQASLKGNFIMNAILAVSGFLFPIITFPYITRVLLPAGTGKITFATSLIAYFSMFAQLGIPTYGIRACAKVRDDRAALTRTVHELLGINLAMDGISYLLLLPALLFIPRLQEERLLFVVISATILLNSIGMEWLYKALERYTYITIRSIVFKAIAVAAMFLLVKNESDYVIYGGISIFASSASNILNFINAGKYVDLRRPEDCDWKKHLKPVFVFFAMSCAATIYTNLDALMLGFMTTNADVGYYGAAVKVKNILVSVVTALGAVLLPRSSYYVEHGLMDEFRRISRKALRFVLICAGGLMVYFILYARESILFLAGGEYENAILPMQIIMPTVLFIGLTNVLGIQILVPMGKEKTVLKSEVAGAVTDLVLNALLIPPFRAAGAAVGTLAAEAVVLGIQYYELRTEVREPFSAFSWGTWAAALTAGAAAGLWVKWTGWTAFFSLAVSAVCFFAVYGLFLLWRKEEFVCELWGWLLRRVGKH